MRSSSFNQQRLISYIFMILSFLSLVAHAIPPEDVEYPELADIQAQLDILRAGLAAYRNADNSNVSSGDAGEYQYGLLPPINEVWHQYNVHAWLEETIRTNGCFSESFVQTDTPGAALSGVNGDEPQTCSIGSYLNLPGHNVPDDIMEELLIALLDAMATFDQVVAILQEASDDGQLNVTWQRLLVTDFTETGLVNAEKYKLTNEEITVVYISLLDLFGYGGMLVAVLTGGALHGVNLPYISFNVV